MNSDKGQLETLRLGTDPKTGKRVFLCDIVARDRLITPSDSTIATDVEIYEAKINLFTVIGYVSLLVALGMPMALILVGKQIAAPFFAIGFAIIGGALVGRNSSIIYPGNLVTTIAQQSGTSREEVVASSSDA
jgi:mannose/fructose/N-acetylgalactosamine-specific phosphotransferase system component IIC